MTGPLDETPREPTEGVARIWQLYADEIGLPDANATARTGSTPLPATVSSTPRPRRPRRIGVGLGVATVTAVVVAGFFVIALGPQIRMLLDSRANRTPSSDQVSVKRADGGDLRAAVTPLRSDERPAVPPSVSAPGEAAGGRPDRPAPAVEFPRTSAIEPIVSRDTGTTPARQTPATEREPRPILAHRIIFDFDSDVLTGESKRTLQEVAAAMKANPDWHLTIAGHTDAHGPSAYNMELSQRRAEAAKAYLESIGVPGQRLRASGFAGSRPFTANGGPLTFLNRRVEFHRR